MQAPSATLLRNKLPPTIFCEPIGNGGHAPQSVGILNVVCLVGRLIYHFISCVHCAVRQMRAQKSAWESACLRAQGCFLTPKVPHQASSTFSSPPELRLRASLPGEGVFDLGWRGRSLGARCPRCALDEASLVQGVLVTFLAQVNAFIVCQSFLVTERQQTRRKQRNVQSQL